VIALDHAQHAGIDGTRVIVEKTQSFIPGIALWDIHSFIEEVLEP
jgi:hypothetical protein